MFRFIGDVCVNKELRRKILYDLFVIVLFMLGSAIPIAGINREYLSEWFQSAYMDGVTLFSLLSGNSFSTMSFFALGVTSYITASIIIQLATVIIPKLEELRKQSQEKIEKYTYRLSIVIAIIEAIGVAFYFYSSGILYESNYYYLCVTTIELVAGSLLIIAIAKSIDDYGIGKGVSIIMLTNILLSLPSSIYNLFSSVVTDTKWTLMFWIGFFFIFSAIIVSVICLQNAEKRVHIQRTGQTRSLNKMNSVNYLPIKLNLGNIMPVIFTSSLFQFIILIANFSENSTLKYISRFFNMEFWFDLNNPIYNLGVLLYFILIILFSYFYAAFAFDVEEIAENLKKQNIVIVNIRPGDKTVKYLNAQLKYFVFIGAFLLTLVILIPTAIVKFLGVSNFSLAGTSLIITISIIVELYKDINADILATKEVYFFS